jgi:hypothetical protein
VYKRQLGKMAREEDLDNGMQVVAELEQEFERILAWQERRAPGN